MENRLVFLLLYAVAIWAVAVVYRRRWPAFAAVFGGLPPVAMLAYFFAEYVVPKAPADPGAVIYILAGGFMALILGVGLLIAVQPRARPAHPCRACGYDLAGVVIGQCPECGFDLASKERRPRRPRHAPPAPAVAPGVSLATQLVAAPAWRERTQESASPSPVTNAAPTTPTPITSAQ